MIIALDFDGVLVKHGGIPRKYGEGLFKDPPMEYALDAVKWLIKEGHEVYILTGRLEKDWDDVRAWLVKWGFPPLEVTNVKQLKTRLIIDDRCLRFTNWQDVCKYFG